MQEAGKEELPRRYRREGHQEGSHVIRLFLEIIRRIKSRLLKRHSYASVAVVAIDMTNPLSVLWTANSLIQKYRSLDVLYLNYSIINIYHINWDVLREAFLTFRLAYFCSTGRTHDSGENFVAVKGSGVTDLGFNRDFCEQVLSPFILAIELSSLLKEATLPGRIVWTGSSTCRFVLLVLSIVVLLRSASTTSRTSATPIPSTTTSTSFICSNLHSTSTFNPQAFRASRAVLA